MNIDYFLDRQLEKHYEEQEKQALVSDCCGAFIYNDDIDICPECKEHCSFETLEEYEYEQERTHYEDRGEY